MKIKTTAAEYRAEARSLSLTAQRVAFGVESEKYYMAASRCARIATLMERGAEHDEAVRRVMRDYGSAA